MHEVRRTTAASPESVWSVLADGWLYPTWVVGASRVRSVDHAWPQKGSRVHHSFGVWPFLLDDISEVLVSEPPHRLVLRAEGRPLGEAEVELTVDAWGSGSTVTIVEDITKGPVTLVPQRARQAAIALRNAEALRRVLFLAEGRARG